MRKAVRLDNKLELAVRYGIIIDAELGALNAWIFMKNNGVQESVILRVLLHREKRREADQQAFELAEKHRNLYRRNEVTRAVFGINSHMCVS